MSEGDSENSVLEGVGSTLDCGSSFGLSVARVSDLDGIPKSHWKLQSKEMKTSRCWGAFKNAFFCCLCCIKTKRRSTESMFIVSGTKWNTHNREPVMLHDIISDDIPAFRDHRSLEITAMMHSVKDDNSDLLNSTSELSLEDGTDLGDLGLQAYLESGKAYSTLPSNEMEGGGTVEKPVGEGCKRKALEETKKKSEPSREARGGEQ